MATYVPAKRATEYIFYVSLVSQADTKLLLANPTLAAGDFTISKDGGAFANLTTLPTVTPASGYSVKITLSNTEMTADNVLVACADAAGAQWCGLAINIQTAARQIDELMPTYTQPTGFLAATFPTDPADESLLEAAIAAVQADTDNIQTRLPAALVSGRIDASVGAYQTGMTAADSVLVTPANKLATDGSGYVTEINVDGIKKNTALSAFEFLMVDSADHVTGKTGLTITATRSIDGGAFAACANSAVEVASGIYKIDLAATDLNGDIITLKFSATGADSRFITLKTNL
jgi:hypothetical protein